MPKSPKKKKTRLPHEDDQPIDDMLDGSGIHQLPDQFGQVISHIHTALYEDYTKHDRAATDYQEWHRGISWIAIGFGTGAILLSLFGVVLEAKGSDLGIDFAKDYLLNFFGAELVFFLAAVICVIIGENRTHWHTNWLEERFWAEEYRTRKFRALLQSSLFCNREKSWNERFYLWRGWFDVEVQAAKNGIKKDIGQCIVSDTVSPPPPGTCGFSFDEGYLRDLIEYYQSKRLRIQIAYFDKHSIELEIRDEQFRKILKIGFTLGIVFVLLQLIDITLLKLNGILPFDPRPFLLQVTYPLQILNTTLLLLLLILPILAFAIRTLRSSTEVARTVSLYRAKRDALVDFKSRLAIENERNPRNWEEIIKILWECENHLEAVNREWIRIMKDAEWFV